MSDVIKRHFFFLYHPNASQRQECSGAHALDKIYVKTEQIWRWPIRWRVVEEGASGGRKGGEMCAR